MNGNDQITERQLEEWVANHRVFVMWLKRTTALMEDVGKNPPRSRAEFDALAAYLAKWEHPDFHALPEARLATVDALVGSDTAPLDRPLTHWERFKIWLGFPPVGSDG